ncbi:bifunctional Peptidase S8 [Babesia duncani]|uniref:subtilisin n=1 Tax=Babesia duncani TaxID=323732 RepID=A0AAD9PJC8_9APIC|nr:bifunctional Peptidase S8 [Babesia duncani]
MLVYSFIIDVSDLVTKNPVAVPEDKDGFTTQEEIQNNKSPRNSRVENKYPVDPLLQPKRLMATLPNINDSDVTDMSHTVGDDLYLSLCEKLEYLSGVNIFIIHLIESCDQSCIDEIMNAVESKGGYINYDAMAYGYDDADQVSYYNPSKGTNQSTSSKFNHRQWYIPAMEIPEAWEELKQGKSLKDVKVCVVDSGVDYKAPSLSSNMYTNMNEPLQPNSNYDTKEYIDEVYGYNFVDDSGDPMDNHGHGTRVASIIAGKLKRPDHTIAGISKSVKIVPCKIFNQELKARISNIIRCIDFCLSVGAQIQYHSWEIHRDKEVLKEAFRAAENNGVLMVVAAGDSSKMSKNDIEHAVVIPTMYSKWFSNILSVASMRLTREQRTQDRFLACITKHKQHDGLCEKNYIKYDLSGNSHYGRYTIHVAAPGTNILSLDHTRKLSFTDGTAMAAAIMTGVCALMLSIETPKNENISLTPPKVIELLRRSTVITWGLNEKVRWDGFVNVALAVRNTISFLSDNQTIQNNQDFAKKEPELIDYKIIF